MAVMVVIKVLMVLSGEMMVRVCRVGWGLRVTNETRRLEDSVDRVCSVTIWMGSYCMRVALGNWGLVAKIVRLRGTHRGVDTLINAGRETIDNGGGMGL